jgi:hypothetical protein
MIKEEIDEDNTAESERETVWSWDVNDINIVLYLFKDVSVSYMKIEIKQHYLP